MHQVPVPAHFRGRCILLQEWAYVNFVLTEGVSSQEGPIRVPWLYAEIPLYQSYGGPLAYQEREIDGMALIIYSLVEEMLGQRKVTFQGGKYSTATLYRLLGSALASCQMYSSGILLSTVDRSWVYST